MIAFDLSDCWSKWGFQDGSLLDDIVYDWLEARDLEPPEGDHHLGFHHEVLYRCVERLVAGRTELMRIGTAHNPVRAKSEWEGTFEDPIYEVATMTRDEVEAVIQEVFDELTEEEAK